MQLAVRRMIKLSNGLELPSVGLGTFRATGEGVQAAVKAAVQCGITHIDTAAIYKNEADIAAALRDAGIPRSSVFITSKVSPYQQGIAKATAACADILQRLDTDCVDLLLIHWPGVARLDAKSPDNAKLRLETWRVLEGLYKSGKARAIGVSNFSAAHIQQLSAAAEVQPMVNQFEVHPKRPETELRAACAAAGIAVVAYASLGCGQLLTEPMVQQVAARVGKTPAQVLLRWGLQQGCAVIPKSVSPERIQQASPDQLLSWELSADDMAALDALEDGTKFCWDASKIL